MTISQERTSFSRTSAGRAEFATAGARAGRGCPWIVGGEIDRPDGSREQLYFIAEPTEPGQRGAMSAKFVSAIRDVYAASTHDDPIVALTGAIEAANDALYQHNRTTAPGSRTFLGLTCLVLRDQDMIICQVPPSQLVLSQGGAPVLLPDLATWRPDYQPNADDDRLGVGATDTATPLLFRAVVEEGDLITLCSTNLARLLATGDEPLDPLLGSDPEEAIAFLRDLAERHQLDPAFGLAFAPQFSSFDRAVELAERDEPGEATQFLAEADEDESDEPHGERWIDRSLREMRDWSRIIPWRRRGGGRIVPLRPKQRAADPDDEGEVREEPRVTAANRHEDLVASHAPARVAAQPVDEPDDALIDEAYRDDPYGEDPEQEEPYEAAIQSPPTLLPRDDADDDERDGDDARDYDDRAEVTEPASLAASPHAPARGAASRRRGGIGRAFGSLVAFVVLVVGSAIERILPAGGRRKNERFLDRSRSRIWPIGNLERHRSGGARLGRSAPLIAVAIVLVAVVVLVLSIRSRQIRAEQRSFDDALDTIARQRGAATASSDKLAAYNQLLALPQRLAAIPGADKSGRPERIAAERASIAVALDQVAGVTRLAGSAVQLAAPLPAAASATASRPQLVTGGGQQFALINGTVYSIDTRVKAFTRILGKGDTINGVSVGQVGGIVWRVDTLFAFTETNGFVRNSTGWSTIPLAGTGRKAAAVESFDGNLYFLEPERGQIVKYPSGSYAQTPQPWSSTKSSTELALALDFAIDKDIYILLSDGRVLDYYQGEMKGSFAPSLVPSLAGASAIAAAPGGRWLYLIDPKEGRIIRLGRDGSLNGIFKMPDDAKTFATARDIAVDETSNTLYVLTDEGLVTVNLP